MRPKIEHDNFGKWLDTPVAERLDTEKSLRAYAKAHSISEWTLLAWRDAKYHNIPGSRSAKSKQDKIKDALYRAAMVGNVKAIELWLEMEGLLKKKPEVEEDYKLSADQIARLSIEAERELNSIGVADKGEDEVSEESSLLPTDIR